MLVWQGILLIVVITGFGVPAFMLFRDNLYNQLDAGLTHRHNVAIQSFIPQRRTSGAGLDITFRLPPEGQRLFESSGDRSFYYSVWLVDRGENITSEEAPPDIQKPDVESFSSTVTFRDRNEFREAVSLVSRKFPGLSKGGKAVKGKSKGSEPSILNTPRAVVVVGCYRESVNDEVRRVGLLLTGLGTVVFSIGMLSGWWLSNRAMRPIESISATAKEIAAGNLEQRIDLAGTESELGELGEVLNESFDRLQAAFQRQQQFTADASHELRTPAYVILSKVQAALKYNHNADECRRDFEVCEKAAKRIQDLIENLLTLARLDAEENTCGELCDLRDIVDSTVEMLHMRSDEKQQTLHFDLETAPLKADPVQIRQVVSNLVENAIYYTQEGGVISITTRFCREHQFAVLVVKDNGPGIEAEDLPHLFERFYRGDKSRSSGQGHTGLGLSICKAIVERCGGKIELSSDLGNGSEFTVKLPGAEKS